MTNPFFNPQPNYSGVTIQIANPSVNVAPNQTTASSGYTGIMQDGKYANQGQHFVSDNYLAPVNGRISGQQGYLNPNLQDGYSQKRIVSEFNNEPYSQNGNTNGYDNTPAMTNPIKSDVYPGSYPPQYYLNNYNYGINGNDNGGINENPNGIKNRSKAFENAAIDGQNNNLQPLSKNFDNINSEPYSGENSYPAETYDVNSYKIFADKNEPQEIDMTRSTNIIEGIDERVAEAQKEKKNTKEKKIVALTDEYIKSLENYLNNPNDEIRLMASKEVLKRLDEDKDRYNDAALNALLNKMMQDPAKLIRIAALSAFASRLASGNDYTVQLLQNIQSNPNADKEDVLQAADILLKMSAGVEVKNIPIPETKQKK